MNNWNYIPRDGLPDVGKRVLVYDHGAKYIAEYSGRVVNTKDGLVPVWDDGQGAMGMFEPAPYPTHWQELPKDPTKLETTGIVTIVE